MRAEVLEKRVKQIIYVYMNMKVNNDLRRLYMSHNTQTSTRVIVTLVYERPDAVSSKVNASQRNIKREDGRHVVRKQNYGKRFPTASINRLSTEGRLFSNE